MARYVATRRRDLRGLGRTFSFVPRRRGLRGLGDSTDIDAVTGLPCDDPRANCGPLVDTTMLPAPSTLNVPPPSFFSNPAPIIPAQKTAPVAAPTFAPTFAPAPVIVFPSSGTVRPTVAAPSSNWLDQQMIAGFPNKYLALATIGGVFLFSMASAKRRR